MKRAAIAVALMIGAVPSVAPVYAHHSFASTYQDKQMAIEGDLVQFVYRNPHAIIQIVAPDGNLQMQRWTVEWEGRGELDHQGVTGTTLKAGDHVVITGNPGKNAADHWMRALTIVRPKDGWKWSVNAASMR
jgi:hypothetical protein